MRDILLEKGQSDFYDIDFENGDFKQTEGLDTAIILSLLTDKRASESEVSEPSLCRGWLGNELNETPGYEMGSKLWLLDQAVVNDNSINNAEDYATDGLSWLIDDQLTLNNTVEATSDFENISIDIEFIRNNNTVLNKQFSLWDNTQIA